VTWSAVQRRALDALCRSIVPAAPSSGALAAAVIARLDDGEARVRSQVSALLVLFDHPVTALLCHGSLRRFSAAAPSVQTERLAAWECSRIPLRRTIFQALRRLIVSTHYADSDAQRAVGYRGPLFRRQPAVPWEGPLEGADPDGAVAATDALLKRAGEAQSWREANARPAGVAIGDDVRRDATITAGVCVVGTGAGGAVVAARLAAAGHDVVILEEGSYLTAADFTEDEASMMPRLYADQGTRATEDLSVTLLQGRAVGGSTTVNWMIMLRTPDWVLDEWTRRHGAVGMSASELAEVFDLVERETHTRVVPDEAHSPNNRIVLDGAKALRWNARSASINAKECVRSGFCGVGCRYGAKQSTLVTYIPRALAAGARLYADAHVERVEIAERGGRAPLKRVRCTISGADGAQRSLTVEAPVVVLAAGAVGTPSILERSGLGGDGVGRYLRLHPTSATIGAYDRTIYGAAGIPLSTMCDEFLRDGDGYGFWMECPPLLPALASVAVPGFGAGHRALMENFPHLGALISLVRDGADREASQGSVHVDRRGRPRVHYRLGARDRATMIRAIGASARLHFAAGAREVTTLHAPPLTLRSSDDVARIGTAQSGPNQLGLFSAHVNGTCRLGSNRATSGCTPDGERHGVPGLYVADGSLLPTAPGVNPQETIMALATVIARRIADRHRPG